MDLTEIERSKKLMDRSCDEIAKIMESYRNTSKENAILLQAMEPMIDELIELKDNLFYCIENPENCVSQNEDPSA